MDPDRPEPATSSAIVKPPPTRRFAKCVIHIGTEKTGSSSIQLFLAKNRGALRRMGWLYPNLPSRSGSQWEFAAAVHRAPWENQEFRDRLHISSRSHQRLFRTSLRKELTSQFDNTRNTSNLILSSEHLHSRLDTETEVRKLKRFLAPWADQFEIIVYFRRQDEALQSLFSTEVKSGNKTVSTEMLHRDVQHLRRFHYDDLFERWQNVFGAGSVRARLFYQTKKSLDGAVGDFMALLSLHREQLTIPDRMNASMNRTGTLFLAQVHRILNENVELDQPGFRERMNEDVSRLFGGTFYRFNREQAELFYNQFKERNERLRQLAFPGFAAPLFEEDFSSYPREIHDEELSSADAVLAAIRLLQTKPIAAAGMSRRRYATKWLKSIISFPR